MLPDQVGDGVAAHLGDHVGQVGLAHELGALLEDRLALVVDHVVVLEEVLADLVVPLLDALLGRGDGVVQPLVGDGLAVLHAEGAHDGVEALAGEDAQQVVLAGQEELGPAGISLAARPAAELVVDPPALVALGAEDEEAARGEGLGLEVRDLRFQLGLA